MSVATSSLRVPISTDYEAQTNGAGPDLQTKVLQIINQKGHFRHVTEQSLLAQDSDEEKDETDNIEQGGNEVEETPEKRDETLMKAREDMFRQMERAQNDTLVALEMVSFLLSKHSMPAQATMSEELKLRVPMGTLDSKVVEERQISEAKAKQFTLTSRGWRSKTFELVSQTLDSASDRMRVEADRESKYWEQVRQIERRWCGDQSIPSREPFGCGTFWVRQFGFSISTARHCFTSPRCRLKCVYRSKCSFYKSKSHAYNNISVRAENWSLQLKLQNRHGRYGCHSDNSGCSR